MTFDFFLSVQEFNDLYLAVDSFDYFVRSCCPITHATHSSDGLGKTFRQRYGEYLLIRASITAAQLFISTKIN